MIYGPMSVRSCFARLLVLVPAALFVAAGPARADTREQQLTMLADRYVAELLAYDPTITYVTGVTTADHSHFPDISPRAIAAHRDRQAAMLTVLRTIDRASLPQTSQGPYAVLEGQLRSSLEVRICRPELWNINHIAGWQASFTHVAKEQPVGSPIARRQALTRWASLPRYVDQDIANLRVGLATGYSAPKSVVRRVIDQAAGLSTGSPTQSPFYAPAERDPDPAFKAALAQVISQRVQPAIRRYHDFLAAEYLPRARDGVAVSELPNGAACYQAMLRQATTLDRSPQQVFALGEATVAANREMVVDLGRKVYGLSDFPAIVARAKSGPENQFGSADELLTYSRALLAVAKAKTATLVDRMPRQDAVVEPQQPFEDAAGAPSHYEPQPDPVRPGVFRIEMKNWAMEVKGRAAIVVVHEAWPGHHLQIALAREFQPDTALAKVAANSAYMEGWARYAERMAEEVGMYDMPASLILRRAWPARGMVVDPGLHIFHWTRQQAKDFLLESGQFTPVSADDMIDRIAVWPGQLTSYDSGGLEIMSLRAEAEAALGARFDVRAFNRVVLEEGIVPLPELRRHVVAWIAVSHQAVAAPR